MMNVQALATVPIAAPPLALVEAVDAARSFAANARSASTLRAYRGAWEAFREWTTAQGLLALPASPETLAAYLAHRAAEGAKPASLNLYLSAIVEAQRAHGHDAGALRASHAVRAVMAGIRRTLGTAQRRAAPATTDVLRRMLETLDGGALGARDRALLLVGFAGAFRRSELVALNVEDLAFSARGVEITIRRSKTDQEGAGRTVAIPFGSAAEVCPVRALRAWLALAGIDGGAAFRAVTRHGQIGEAALTGRAVALVVKRSAAAAGIDAALFSGHSLRAGLATSAANAGRSDRAIMAQGRWRGRGMVDRYVRAADAWRDNAAAGLL